MIVLGPPSIRMPPGPNLPVAMLSEISESVIDTAMPAWMPAPPWGPVAVLLVTSELFMTSSPPGTARTPPPKSASPSRIVTCSSVSRSLAGQ